MLNEKDQDQLFKYFKPSFKMKTTNNGVIVFYFLALDNGAIGIYICQLYNVLDNTITIIERENLIDELITNEFVMDYIKNLFHETFDEELKQYIIQFKKEFVKKQNDDFINEIKKMSAISISKEQGKLSEKNIVGVEYYFIFDDNKLYLSLKVGCDKYYIVKNLNNFFFAIKNNEILSYGKNLSFCHRIDNFCKMDQPVLNIIEGIRSESHYSNYKECQIPLSTFPLLLESLKNRYIYYNNNYYLVRLDQVKVEISIDENYCLQTSLSDEVELVDTKQNLIIFNKSTSTIDIVSCDFHTNELILLSKQYEGFNIQPVKKQFIDYIYMHHQDDIIISPKIKNDFKTSTISINAYFDFQLSSITLKVRYFKNEKEINEKEIIDYFDVQKHKQFIDYITDLGFDDNTLKEQDEIYRFLTMDFSYLKKLCKVYLSENITSKQMVKFKQPAIRVNYENNLLSFILEKSQYSDDELYKILKAIRHKQKFYILNKNTIIDLNNDESNQFKDFVEDLKLNEKALTAPVEKPLYQSFKLQDYDANISFDEYIETMLQEIANFKTSKFELPKLNATLRPYQIEGYNWMRVITKYNLGGILADDMGLGKTLEIIALLKSDEKKMPSLIICPKSLIFNWHSEFAKFDCDTKVVEIYGTQNERKDTINAINPNEKVIYITSYDSLRNDENEYLQTFNYLIIDEGQYIKNINAKKTKTVKSIKANQKMILTGTPIENNIFDLWSLFDFIMPDYLPNINVFKSNATKDEFLKVIAKKISPFVLRRTKQEVLDDLPSKYERIVTAELTGEQSQIYDAYVLKAKEALDNKEMIDVLAIITRLRQICVNPSTFIEDYTGSSGKMEILMSLIDEYTENGHRMLVFSQFVKSFDKIEENLKAKNILFYKLTGDTKAEDRIRLTNEFNSNEEIKVFLISLKAGGTGLNLIGADTVIHLDPWWNVSAENQATDRTHRIGQTHNVEVIKLICRNTIEQRVIELQNIKKDLIDKLIAKDDTSITKLSKDDLTFILK